MKNNHFSIYVPLLLVILFALLTPQVIWLSGLFAIAILLSGLRKFDLKRVLIILSPIFAYPLFLILLVPSVIFPIMELQVGLFVYDFLFAIAYFFVLRDVGNWIEPGKKIYLTAALVILVVIMLIYVPLINACDFFYYEGGKGALDLASKCDSAGLLVKSYEHAKFRVSGINSSITIYNVVFTIVSVLFAMYIKPKATRP